MTMKNISIFIKEKLFSRVAAFIYVFLSFFFPDLALAQGGLKTLLLSLQGVINLLIKVAVAFAVVFFFWGLAKMILRGGDEKATEEGKKIMVWGIIALFVIIAIWGIVTFIQQAFGLQTNVPFTAPQF